MLHGCGPVWGPPYETSLHACIVLAVLRHVLHAAGVMVLSGDSWRCLEALCVPGQLHCGAAGHGVCAPSSLATLVLRD